jgi:hypothetical protein
MFKIKINNTPPGIYHIFVFHEPGKHKTNPENNAKSVIPLHSSPTLKTFLPFKKI